MQRGRRSWPAVVAVWAVGAALLAVPLGTGQGALAIVPAPTAVPSAPPRVAFTDDRDGLEKWIVPGPESSPPPEPVSVGAATRHEGEASTTFISRRLPRSAFVSTRDDARGEVYFGTEPGRPSLRVTCNADVETHPVISPDGTRVAYASDSGGRGSRVWVADIVSDDSAVLTDCRDVRPRQVTFGPGQDLWPSWMPDSIGLVFSGVRDGDLGNLYVLRPNATPVPLTTDADPARPDADTQPAVGRVSEGGDNPRVVVAFTTTRQRSDGSLALVELPKPNATRLPVVEYLWPDGSVQGSEAAWSSDQRLAFTSRQADPYGDVWTADLSLNNGVITVSGSSRVGRRGVAESHGAWGETTEGGTALFVTRRSHDADVSDVGAADGSLRRAIAARSTGDGGDSVRLDEAGPTYSPDGSRLAHSRSTLDGGRELVVSAADGSGATAVDDGRQRGDVDLDPAWSPDGTRLAFVRFRLVLERYGQPQVWVVDLSTRVARVVTGAAPGRDQYGDEDPSWSPDSRRLALTRHSLRAVTSLVVRPADGFAPLTVVADASASTDPRREQLTYRFAFGDGTPVEPSPTPRRNHTYARPGDYLVRVVMTNASGLSTTAEQMVVVRPAAPTAALSVTPTEGAAPLVVVADASGSRDPQGQRLSYAFDFGDQTPVTTTTSPTVRHIYRVVGTYALRVVVTNTSGLQDTDSKDVVVNSVIDRTAPAAPAAPAVPRLATVRAEPAGPPAVAPGLLWTVDAVTGAGAPVLVPHVCPPTKACLPTPASGRSPAWSPDGLRVAYDDAGSVRLLTLVDGNGDGRADVPERATGEPTALTGFRVDRTPTLSRRTLSMAEDPAWSPDGTELAVAGQPAGQPDQRGIYVLAADGTGLRELAQDRGPETEPVWQPSETADVAVTVTVVDGLVDGRDLGWVGGRSGATFMVTNRGPSTAQAVTLAPSYPPGVTAAGPQPCLAGGGPACAVGTLLPGQSRLLTVDLLLTAAGTGSIAGLVTTTTLDPVPANNRAARAFTVEQPTLRLLPPIGPPGFVTLAFAEHLPPGSSVTLRWLGGITANPGPFPVESDGTLRLPVLVLRRDSLGQRQAELTGAPGLFGAVKAPMLVVARPLAPPRFLGRG